MKKNTSFKLISLIGLTMLTNYYGIGQTVTYPIVDTDVHDFYSNNAIISAPAVGQTFYGQDATYNGNQPSYTNNGDGTITDNVTGLMWEQDMGTKITYTEAFTKASNSTLGGYNDWRVPTMKELYSLIQFSGRVFGDYAVIKFIDTNYFNQPIGNTAIGEREIDAQTWSSNQYKSLTMNGDTTVFGVNFIDGRVKGYPKYQPGPTPGAPKTMYFRMVRGTTLYGINDFVDNFNGTITDNATGLMWQQADDGNSRNWEASLSYAENLTLAGYSDWRLPNAKELHSIVDYNRCPDFTNSPAIDPLFFCSTFNNPVGNPNYGYYWSSSPLMDGPTPYTDAAYVCFGEAQGQMSLPPLNTPTIYDTHGAGACRNDPKEMASGTTYPTYFGPQGDIIYVNNYVRCVRDVSTTSIKEESVIEFNVYPNPAQQMITISSSESIKTVSIYNAQGILVVQPTTNTTNSISVDISNYPVGLYFIEIIGKDSKFLKKFIKN